MEAPRAGAGGVGITGHLYKLGASQEPRPGQGQTAWSTHETQESLLPGLRTDGLPKSPPPATHRGAHGHLELQGKLLGAQARTGGGEQVTPETRDFLHLQMRL